ncbi:site-2 protease family protein [Candidatus Kaiserbacteria bacterium]|nr:site-2 protease family protein [Candidatus Kaiserbacteria bacterium]
MDQYSIEQLILAGIVPVLFAITLHEVAHGWAARQLGDDTAERLGRLSINPLHHIDPVGTILIPGLMLAMKTGFMFGWAKPVPVDFGRLRKPRRDMALVAIAGPAANLLMAIFWALMARASGLLPDDSPYIDPLQLMSEIGIKFNLMLALVNLVPIPPLDGGRLMVGILPYHLADKLARVEPYGFFVLLGLMFTGILNIFIALPWHILYGLLNGIAQL